ncbi:pentapeptide repeat-containing protein [Vacuolonema iberomarrocanum]|uniref:pentapeptide repeat-containing protein n=1 Tax=Vacuolonema iberomarrocanum TaxID=3454632 RepID=UPI0019DB56B9|nr:pentapeptide repeat-containing protein [filamentous cyanobacterium LEGE 07170]
MLNKSLKKILFKKSIFEFSIFIFVIFFLVALVVIAETFYVRPSNAQEKIDFILMIGRILGGTALLLGAYFTWKQLQVTLDGKITDRISQAIDHIGSKDLSIRLGGLYSLERIAIDSRRDLPNIIEIICAFIRVSSPSPFIDRRLHSVVTERELSKEELNKIVEEQFHRPRLTEDIQVGLQILARITQLYKIPEESHLYVTRNLFGVNVKGAILPDKANLSFFLLDNSQLDYVFASNAVMTRSRVNNSNLRGSLLHKIDLSNSDLSGSHMEHAYLCKAILRETRFLSSRLICANLIEVQAEKANFNQARLKRANFSKAILKKAVLSFADLRESILTEADLSSADLSSADLSNSKLDGADLSGAIFQRTQLYEVDLTNVKNLTGEQLDNALLCKTTLANGEVSNRDCEKIEVSQN